MESSRRQFPLTLAELVIILALFAALHPLLFLEYCGFLAALYVPCLFFLHGLNAFAIMEAKAAELVALLKSNNHSVDTKVGQLSSLKSDIKQKNVPEGAVPSIFESLRLAIGSQHSSLIGAGFSTLGHLLRRLFIQNQHHLVQTQSRNLYPLLVERLGDYKERIRTHAAQAFTDIWPAASSEVEHHVLEVALVGKNPRAKETSMIWLANMAKHYGLLFRAYVPSLVACLEDADSAVRETAKATVIELFKNAPPRAQSDLKKQLVILDVRKSIANAILASIGLADQDVSSMHSQSRPETLRPASSFSHYRHREEIERPKSVLAVRSHSHADASRDKPEIPKEPELLQQLDLPKSLELPKVLEFSKRHEPPLDPKPLELPNSLELPKKPEPPKIEIPKQHEMQKQHEVHQPPEIQKHSEAPRKNAVKPKPTASHGGSAESVQAPASPVEAPEDDKIEPLYVHSHKEIDEIVREMLPHFEGKESERNWNAREKSIMTLRRLTRGNAPHDYSQHFLGAFKTLLDGILKVVNSLRTTLAASGCLLIQEVARTCGSGIDPMVEIILQDLIKLCGAMKKISSQTCNSTVDTIFANASYSSRVLQHVWLASQEKNAQLRLFAAGWLKTLINKQARHKSSVEHGGGLELMEKCIKKGLADANPGVRESMRGTFWVFYKVWPGKANEIMSTLDAKSKSLLEKDPANPNVDASSHAASSGGPRPGLSSSTSAAAKRPTLKETIAAQKKAKQAAGKNLPPRPESAQSFSEAKTTQPAAASRAPAAKSSTVRTVPTGTHLSSLSSAPMRPAIKPRRPEISRPATADPYAARRPPTAGSQRKEPSPVESPQKATKAKMTATPGTKSSKPSAAPVSTTKGKPKRLEIATLKSTDARPMMKHSRTDSDEISKPSSEGDEDLTMVMPAVCGPQDAVSLSEKDPEGLSTETKPVPENDASDISEASPPSSPVDERAPSTPRPRLNSDGTTNRSPITALRRPSTNSEDSAASIAVSPSRRHSIGGSEDHSSMIPTSTVRSMSTPKEVPSADPVKVYEDPQPSASKEAISPTTTETRSPKENRSPKGNRSPNAKENLSPLSTVSNRSGLKSSNALEELPLNEPAYRDNRQLSSSEESSWLEGIETTSSENTHRRWRKIEIAEKRRSISPRSKDPVKAWDMIDKGIKRIKANAMDVHGYRKLQGLIKYHDSIFTDEEKYDEMLMALLEDMEGPPDGKPRPMGRPLDLKTQVLVTIRLMFAHKNPYVPAYYPRLTVAMLNARKHYDINCHIVSGLERTVDDVVMACKPREVMEAVLDLIETEERDDEGYRAIGMGIYVMNGLFRRLNKSGVRMTQPVLERVGKFAQEGLKDPRPDIRRATTELCVELHRMLRDEQEFWRLVDSPQGDYRNLLTYYIAKGSKGSSKPDKK